MWIPHFASYSFIFVLQFLVVLFQEDVLKLLGNILEETYGPLCSSEAAVGAACSTHTVSELLAVDGTANYADICTQVNSSSRFCERAAANVTRTSTVLQRPPAEVSISSVQSLNVGDANSRPSVANSFLLSESSDPMSNAGNHPSDTARAWSTGTLVTDGSGKSVEVNVMLFHLFTFLSMFAIMLLLCFVTLDGLATAKSSTIKSCSSYPLRFLFFLVTQRNMRRFR